MKQLSQRQLLIPRRNCSSCRQKNRSFLSYGCKSFFFFLLFHRIRRARHGGLVSLKNLLIKSYDQFLRFTRFVTGLSRAKIETELRKKISNDLKVIATPLTVCFSQRKFNILEIGPDLHFCPLRIHIQIKMGHPVHLSREITFLFCALRSPVYAIDKGVTPRAKIH